jgi:hypothetical protein
VFLLRNEIFYKLEKYYKSMHEEFNYQNDNIENNNNSIKILFKLHKKHRKMNKKLNKLYKITRDITTVVKQDLSYIINDVVVMCNDCNIKQENMQRQINDILDETVNDKFKVECLINSFQDVEYNIKEIITNHIKTDNEIIEIITNIDNVVKDLDNVDKKNNNLQKELENIVEDLDDYSNDFEDIKLALDGAFELITNNKNDLKTNISNIELKLSKNENDKNNIYGSIDEIYEIINDETEKIINRKFNRLICNKLEIIIRNLQYQGLITDDILSESDKIGLKEEIL